MSINKSMYLVFMVIAFFSCQKSLQKTEYLFQPNDISLWNQSTIKCLLDSQNLNSNLFREKEIPPILIGQKSSGKSYVHGFENDLSTVWLFLNNRGNILSYINTLLIPNNNEEIEILEFYSFFKKPIYEITYSNSLVKVVIQEDGSIKRLNSTQKSEIHESHEDIRKRGAPLINLIIQSKIFLNQTGERRFETLASYIDSSPY